MGWSRSPRGHSRDRTCPGRCCGTAQLLERAFLRRAPTKECCRLRVRAVYLLWLGDGLHSARCLSALLEPRASDTMATMDDQSFAWCLATQFHRLSHATFWRLL